MYIWERRKNYFQFAIPVVKWQFLTTKTGGNNKFKKRENLGNINSSLHRIFHCICWDTNLHCPSLKRGGEEGGEEGGRERERKK